MSQLMTTNADLGYYSDFDKCRKTVDKIAIKLNQLNYLMGKSDFEQAVRDLWDENPKVFSILNILIAVRDASKEFVLDSNRQARKHSDFFESADGVIEYLTDTGLRRLFEQRQITNLVDYVFGVEVGLDTNARKNRSGHLMERMVATILRNNGIEFEQEVESEAFPDIKAVLGEDIKRFDFVIRASDKTYLMEVNFYNGGGSKLNEVARAYMEISEKVNSCSGYDFVWITDGRGWKHARKKLEEAFLTIPHVFNITTIGSLIHLIKDSEQ